MENKKDYEPYGDDWRDEMRKLEKDELIEMLREFYMLAKVKDKLTSFIEKLRDELSAEVSVEIKSDAEMPKCPKCSRPLPHVFYMNKVSPHSKALSICTNCLSVLKSDHGALTVLPDEEFNLLPDKIKSDIKRSIAVAQERRKNLN